MKLSVHTSVPIANLAADELSRGVIDGALEVHRHKGPGLIESIDERCLMRVPGWRGATAVNQRRICIAYKGITLAESLRFGVLVEGSVLLELKSGAGCPADPQGVFVKLHEAS
jgi:GxxExxY protein